MSKFYDLLEERLHAAELEGRAAYRNGERANPYERGTRFNERWLKGYQAQWRTKEAQKRRAATLTPDEVLANHFNH